MNAKTLRVMLAASFLGGCASTSEVVTGGTAPQRPMHSAADYNFRDDGPADIYDPFESVNRTIYTFNARFDEYVFLPIVYAYEAVMPDPLEDRISDFFSNLSEIPTFANSLLQGNMDHAGRALHRFAINTTVGLLGFVDIASAAGVPQEREDFGQTLGVWGMDNGPYIVLPILGPSNLRDTTGLAVTTLATMTAIPGDTQDTTAYKAANYGLRPVNVRRNIGFRYYNTSSPFEYDLVRLLYTQKRELDIER
ncbi:MAG: VacJ family lipoprotein [Geminicoccaceae bacterium]|nr:VacJ family lipoprotein [Geminicoccaceae bacterium]